MCLVPHLIYKDKPAANVRGRCWRRKVEDGIYVFGQELDGFVRYAEPCEVNNSPCEIEFLCVEHDSYTDEKVNGSPPVRMYVGVIVDGVIHSTFLSLKVRYYHIEASVVAVTRGKEASRRPRVSPRPNGVMKVARLRLD